MAALRHPAKGPTTGVSGPLPDWRFLGVGLLSASTERLPGLRNAVCGVRLRQVLEPNSQTGDGDRDGNDAGMVHDEWHERSSR